MLTPEDIHPGLILRVINSHGINVPLRSLATVETIEHSNSGDWFCTIRYHGKRLSQRRQRLYRSHLWASDLGCFEVVKEQQQEQQPVGNTISKTETTREAKRAQLSLPFSSRRRLKD
jgi:hypothetical protein